MVTWFCCLRACGEAEHRGGSSCRKNRSPHGAKKGQGAGGERKRERLETKYTLQGCTQ
jgi:hypothetical protein